jgi:ribosomal protein S18 acetylase RimI-like enzyme
VLPIVFLPVGYRLRGGSVLDRSLLVKFMQRTYAEMNAVQPGSHLAHTVDQYFSAATPLWWIDQIEITTIPPIQSAKQGDLLPDSPSALVRPLPIAGLWMGNAVDQIVGDRHAHIFMLYVAPDHRRQGLGRALMQQAEDWAVARGDRQIGLQVFQSNQAAIGLYHSLGFMTQALCMIKPLSPE